MARTSAVASGRRLGPHRGHEHSSPNAVASHTTHVPTVIRSAYRARGSPPRTAPGRTDRDQFVAEGTEIARSNKDRRVRQHACPGDRRPAMSAAIRAPRRGALRGARRRHPEASPSWPPWRTRRRVLPVLQGAVDIAEGAEVAAVERSVATDVQRLSAWPSTPCVRHAEALGLAVPRPARRAPRPGLLAADERSRSSSSILESD